MKRPREGWPPSERMYTYLPNGLCVYTEWWRDERYIVRVADKQWCPIGYATDSPESEMCLSVGFAILMHWEMALEYSPWWYRPILWLKREVL